MAQTARMIRVDIVLALLLAGVWIYGVAEVFTTDPRRMRLLPLSAWGTFVLLVPVLGAVAWFVAGRPRASAPAYQPLLAVTEPPADLGDLGDLADVADADAESAEEFRRRVRERAEEQRRRYAESQAQRAPEEDGPATGDGPD